MSSRTARIARTIAREVFASVDIRVIWTVPAKTLVQREGESDAAFELRRCLV